MMKSIFFFMLSFFMFSFYLSVHSGFAQSTQDAQRQGEADAENSQENSIRRLRETPEEQLERGYKAYQEGDWTEVVQSLSEAAKVFSEDDLLYLYLGTSYQILGNDLQAEKTLIQGVNLQGENMQRISFVLGNYYYSIGEYSKAVDAYNLATWSDKQLVQAFLNRANLYLSLGFYSNALNDYSYFLFRKPFDPQREKIEVIIQKLSDLGAKGRIQADEKVITGAIPQEYPYPGGYDGTGSFPKTGEIPLGTSAANAAQAGQKNADDSLTNDTLTNGNNGAEAGSKGSSATAENPAIANAERENASNGLANGSNALPGANDISANGNDEITAGSKEDPATAVASAGQEGQGNNAADRLSNTAQSNNNLGVRQSGLADSSKVSESGANGNSLEDGIYRRPAGDTGNTVGTGGSFEAQIQQLNQTRNSLRELNQSAIILSRDRPDIIEQRQSFPGINE